MRAVVSLYIHGTWPDSIPSYSTRLKENEKYHWMKSEQQKQRDGHQQPALLCERENIAGQEPAAVLTVTRHSEAASCAELDNRFTQRTCDSYRQYGWIKQHYSVLVSPLLVLVLLWIVHLEITWQVFIVQLPTLPCYIINAFDVCLLPSDLKMMMASAAVFDAILLSLPHFMKKK